MLARHQYLEAWFDSHWQPVQRFFIGYLWVWIQGGLVWLPRFLARAKKRLLIIHFTPFSPIFLQILAVSGLRDSGVDFGWQPFWPTYVPFLWIPIDHVLLSPEVQVHRIFYRFGPLSCFCRTFNPKLECAFYLKRSLVGLVDSKWSIFKTYSG